MCKDASGRGDIFHSLLNFLEQNIEFYRYAKRGVNDACPIFPLHVYIEPINVCNLRCVYCGTPQLKRKRESMSLELYKVIIEEIRSNNFTQRITLTGQGEPLLHKEIAQMVKIARDSGLYVSIITNATVLDQNLGKALIRAGLDRVQCSFDSLVKEDYEKVQVNADFNKTLTNILLFLKENHDSGGKVFVSISRVESGLVRDKKEDFEKFWYSLPVDNVFAAPLSNLQGKSPMTEQITIPRTERPLCMIPWMSLTIKAGGEITPCTHDYDNEFVIGQMGRDKLVDVWNNEKIRTLRRNLINKELGKITSLNCAGCNNPFIGYSIEDYISGFYQSLSRWILAFGKKVICVPEDEVKYKNLMKVLEESAKCTRFV